MLGEQRIIMRVLSVMASRSCRWIFKIIISFIDIVTILVIINFTIIIITIYYIISIRTCLNRIRVYIIYFIILGK